MIPFNWFDVFLAMIVLASAFAGLRSGLARVIVGLVATMVGLLAAFWSYRLVSSKLLPYIHSATLADVLGFFTIFFGVLLFGALVASILSNLLKWVGLSWFNHVLGGVAGLIRGVLLVAIMVDVFIAFSPSPTPAFLNQSRLLPYATPLAAWLADAAPRELKDAFDAQMQNIIRMAKPLERHEAHEI